MFGSTALLLPLFLSSPLLWIGCAALQDDEPVPAVDRLVASDSEPAAPGRVPEGTPRDAAELWQGVIDSLAVADQPPKPRPAGRPTAYELEFSVRNRSESGTQNFNARFAYLEEHGGLVKTSILANDGSVQQVQMRGVDDGPTRRYWYRKLQGEGKTDGWVHLAGRDYKDDRREIDNWAAIAFDIARLTDPASFRIVRLRARRLADAAELDQGLLRFEGDPGVRLPNTDVQGVIDGKRKKVRELAKELVWVQLDTPDIDLFSDEDARPRRRDDKRTDVRRLVFGLDPKTRQPRLVVVSPFREGPLQVPGTVLVQSTDWFVHGPDDARTQLPGRFFVYETPTPDDSTRQAPKFADTTIADLYVLDGGTMRAPLTVDDFRPND